MSTDQPVPAPPTDVVGPLGPVPPRSRHRWHIGALVLTVLGGPVSFVLIAGAMSGLLDAYAEGRPAPATALLATTAGALIVGGAAWLGARTSAGAATAGAVWLGLGALAVIRPATVPAMTGFLPERLDELSPRAGAELLLLTGGTFAVGAALVGAAIATTIARSRGRSRERHELRAVASGEVRTPPRSRLLAHLASALLAVVLTVPAVALLDVAAPESATPGGIDDAVRPALVLAVAALLVTATVGFLSSLGPAIAGGIWLASFLQVLLTRSPSLVTRAGAPAMELVPDAVTAGPQLGADAGGLTLAIALTLVGAAVGSHLARRDGRAAQRSEHRASLSAARAA